MVLGSRMRMPRDMDSSGNSSRRVAGERSRSNPTAAVDDEDDVGEIGVAGEGEERLSCEGGGGKAADDSWDDDDEEEEGTPSPPPI